CSLTGTWKNDLASTMEINSVSNTGVSSGLYQTAVSASDVPIRPPPLQGVQIHLHLFGPVVDEGGEEQLKTIWLLRVKVGRAEMGEDRAKSLVDKNGEEQLKTAWLLCGE
ncbi:avidin-like, partial [Protobothrops mucrosquamatus]|uniref:avidin-like n=1 Tax=Protobothrops mucrosquamatus TaxID=103944 RepID=UPI00077593A8